MLGISERRLERSSTARWTYGSRFEHFQTTHLLCSVDTTHSVHGADLNWSPSGRTLLAGVDTTVAATKVVECCIGLMLWEVDGKAVAGWPLESILDTIRHAGRPLSLVFSPVPPDVAVIIESSSTAAEQGTNSPISGTTAPMVDGDSPGASLDASLFSDAQPEHLRLTSSLAAHMSASPIKESPSLQSKFEVVDEHSPLEDSKEEASSDGGQLGSKIPSAIAPSLDSTLTPRSISHEELLARYMDEQRSRQMWESQATKLMSTWEAECTKAAKLEHEVAKVRKQAAAHAEQLEAKIEEAEKARKETFKQHQKDKLLLKDALQLAEASEEKIDLLTQQTELLEQAAFDAAAANGKSEPLHVEVEQLRVERAQLQTTNRRLTRERDESRIAMRNAEPRTRRGKDLLQDLQTAQREIDQQRKKIETLEQQKRKLETQLQLMKSSQINQGDSRKSDSVSDTDGKAKTVSPPVAVAAVNSLSETSALVVQKELTVEQMKKDVSQSSALSPSAGHEQIMTSQPRRGTSGGPYLPLSSPLRSGQKSDHRSPPPNGSPNATKRSVSAIDGAINKQVQSRGKLLKACQALYDAIESPTKLINALRTVSSELSRYNLVANLVTVRTEWCNYACRRRMHKIRDFCSRITFSLPCDQ
eukprot:SAG31_NODE_1885_length_6990_cov_2.445218_5_plen_645_part_00